MSRGAGTELNTNGSTMGGLVVAFEALEVGCGGIDALRMGSRWYMGVRSRWLYTQRWAIVRTSAS